MQGSSADPSTIYVDLGATATIHTISIDWENAAGATYVLQVSNDQSNPTHWTTVATETNNTGAGIKTYGGLNATGRFVQMAGMTRTGPYGYSIIEMPLIGYFTPSSSAAPSTQVVFTTPPTTPLASGGNAGNVGVALEDGSGNIATGDSSSTVTLAVAGPSNYAQSYTATVAGGVATFALGNTPLTTAGSYTYTAGSGSLTAGMASETVTAAGGAATAFTVTGLSTFTAPGIAGTATSSAVPRPSPRPPSTGSAARRWFRARP